MSIVWYYPHPHTPTPTHPPIHKQVKTVPGIIPAAESDMVELEGVSVAPPPPPGPCPTLLLPSTDTDTDRSEAEDAARCRGRRGWGGCGWKASGACGGACGGGAGATFMYTTACGDGCCCCGCCGAVVAVVAMSAGPLGVDAITRPVPAVGVGEGCGGK